MISKIKHNTKKYMQINGEVWFLFKKTTVTNIRFLYSIKKDSKVESSNKKHLGKRLQDTGGRATSQIY